MSENVATPSPVDREREEARSDILQGLAYSTSDGPELLAGFEVLVREHIAQAILAHAKAAVAANADDTEDYIDGMYVGHLDSARIARGGR